ncbi:MAG: hypothetical protein IKF91_03005 [Bacilli bacterium]|nr:hypothetical protein [Bacilli bacterium]
MKKYFIIAFILIFVCLFCIKSSAFGEIIEYDFCLKMDSVIQNIKNDINNNEEDHVINKKYFEIIQLKNNFIRMYKNNVIRIYYNVMLNKICIYIVTAIFEKNTIWLNESIKLLQETFGDYKKNYIYL